MSRTSGLVLMLLLVPAVRVSAAGPASYALNDKSAAGAVFDVSADLQVTGRAEVKSGAGTAAALPLAVRAGFRYSEKRLVDTHAIDESRSVRYYRTAQAAIEIDKQKSTPTLRPHVQLMVAQGQRGGPMFFSPGGPLTRDELDLLKLPGDSLVVPAILPANPVALGDKWTPETEAMQALVGLDVVGQCEVTCTLAEVNDGIAKVQLSGTVSGGVDGAETQISLDGHFLFHLEAGYVTRLELTQKEKRSVGHVAPGLNVEARVVVSQQPADNPKELSDEVLSGIPLEPNPAIVQLAYESPDGKLRFYYDRQWQIFFSDQGLTVLRLLDRGDLVAQCNISRMPAVAPGRHADPNRFQQDVIKVLGNQFQRLVQAGEVPGDDGRWIYRLAAVGAAGELPVQWTYYLVAGPGGDQAVFVYTMEAKMAERFGTRDLAMVGTVEFPKSSPAPPTRQTAEKTSAPAQ